MSAGEQQEGTLLRILQSNKSCLLGQRWEFECISSVEEYQKRVPLTTYEDYSELIDRMVNENEEKLTTCGTVVGYLPTSGTTGTSKLIPKLAPPPSPAGAAVDRTGGMIPDFLPRPICLLANMHPERFTPHGLPIIPGSSSQLPGLLKMEEFYPSLFTAPPDAYVTEDFAAATYVQALFTLCNDQTGCIFAGFINTVIGMFSVMESRWASLVSDMRNCKISVELGISGEATERLQDELRRICSEERCRQIEQIFGDSPAPLVPLAQQLWPKLRYVTCL